MEMKQLKVTISGEGFGEQVTVWWVPDFLVKPYTVFLTKKASDAYVEASEAVHDAVTDEAAETRLLDASK